MPNTLTLTGFTELLYEARDIVAAEPSALIDSVMINSGSEGVSINGTVQSFRTAQPTLNTSYTPAMTVPSGDDQTLTVDTMVIDQVARVSIPFQGETWKQIENTAGREAVRDALFAQAIRKIRNAIEAHVGSVVYKGASRAVGTAGTTPFAANHNLINSARQILVDNGCPVEDGQVSLVINTAAGVNLRNLTNLYKVSEAGESSLLRRGTLVDISGISIKESAGIASHTKGTGAGYLVNQVGLTTDSTAITVDTGTGTILAGDIVTFASGAGSGHNYVVGSALATNAFSLNYPGLRGAIADNNAITVGNNYTANVAFHRNAVELAMRPPSLPPGGDLASDRMTIQDPKSGLVFEAALYPGYGMNVVELCCFYKAEVWKPEFVATIMG